jgi:hypothetical protein
MLPSVIGGPGGCFGFTYRLRSSHAVVVRSSLFLCAALPVIFSAGPFFAFRLGFVLAALAFLDIRISVNSEIPHEKRMPHLGSAGVPSRFRCPLSISLWIFSLF